jgi:hypothetical protein
VLAAPPAGTWTWGYAAAERLVQNVVLGLRAAHALAVQEGGPAPEIATERATATACLALIRRRRTRFGQAVGRQGPAATPALVAADGPALAALVRRAVGLLAARRGVEPEALLERLLRVEVVQRSLAPDLARPLEPFEFVRLSADTENALGIDMRRPDAKLAGLQLAHFGGFLKRSWRANDWMWGRLDGVAQLLRIVLSDAHLEGWQEWNPALAGELAAIAFPQYSPSLTGELIRLWNEAGGTADPTDVGSAQAEFAAAFAGDAVQRFRAREAVVARIQLAALCEEAPVLVAQARLDRDQDGWRRESPIPDLPADTAEAPPERLLRLVRDDWGGAGDRVRDEVGSTAFARHSSRAAVVAASSLASTRGGLPVFVRGALRWLRGATLGAYGFVRSFAHSTFQGLMVALAVATLIVIALVTSDALAALLLPIGFGVAVATVALVSARLGPGGRIVLAHLALVAAGVAIVLAAGELGATGREQAWVIVAVVAWVGALALFVLMERWLVFPVTVVALVVAALGLSGYGDLAGWWGRAVCDDSLTECGRAYLADHRAVLLMTIALTVPLVIGSRGLARAAEPPSTSA